MAEILKTVGATCAAASLAGCITVNNAPPTGTRSETVAPHHWSGVESDDAPFPGRLQLPLGTCGRWTPDNPQPVIWRDGNLHVVVDARFSYPPECDPDKDTGVGRHVDASVESPVQPGLNGERYSRDGTVVRVLGYTAAGELTCRSDSTGQTATWLKVWDGTGSPETNWFIAAESNFGYAPDEALGIADIPQFDSAYAGTRQGGC